MATEEKGTKLQSYMLPVHEPERNFPHVQKKQWFKLGDLQKGDYAGMTESDGKSTDGKDHGPYTPLQESYYGAKSVEGGKKLGTSVKLDKHARNG